jgi:hypothetical protein
MVVLPAGHRLAGKEEVIETDLAGESLVWHAGPSTQPTTPRLRAPGARGGREARARRGRPGTFDPGAAVLEDAELGGHRRFAQPG